MARNRKANKRISLSARQLICYERSSLRHFVDSFWPTNLDRNRPKSRHDSPQAEAAPPANWVHDSNELETIAVGRTALVSRIEYFLFKLQHIRLKILLRHRHHRSAHRTSQIVGLAAESGQQHCDKRARLVATGEREQAKTHRHHRMVKLHAALYRKQGTHSAADSLFSTNSVSVPVLVFVARRGRLLNFCMIAARGSALSHRRCLCRRRRRRQQGACFRQVSYVAKERRSVCRRGPILSGKRQPASISHERCPWSKRANYTNNWYRVTATTTARATSEFSHHHYSSLVDD
jgi:hypothetical protein